MFILHKDSVIGNLLVDTSAKFNRLVAKMNAIEIVCRSKLLTKFEILKHSSTRLRRWVGGR